MKKWTTGLLVAAIVTSLSVVAFADGFGKGFRKDGERPAWTEQQKNDFIQLAEQKHKLHTEFLNGEAAAGRMSQEEANAHITLAKIRLDRMKDGDFKNHPAFSEEGKAARLAYHQKTKALHIDSIKKAMANGSISEEKGNQMIEKMEKSNNDRDGFHHRKHKGGHRGHFTR